MEYHPERTATVLVKNIVGEPVSINRADYEADPEAWELVEDDETPAPADMSADMSADAAGTNAAAVQMVVSKIGKTFFVTDTEKNKIAGVAGIDESGYVDEGAAWAAIMAATTAATNG